MLLSKILVVVVIDYNFYPDIATLIAISVLAV